MKLCLEYSSTPSAVAYDANSVDNHSTLTTPLEQLGDLVKLLEIRSTTYLPLRVNVSLMAFETVKVGPTVSFILFEFEESIKSFAGDKSQVTQCTTLDSFCAWLKRINTRRDEFKNGQLINLNSIPLLVSSVSQGSAVVASNAVTQNALSAAVENAKANTVIATSEPVASSTVNTSFADDKLPPTAVAPSVVTAAALNAEGSAVVASNAVIQTASSAAVENAKATTVIATSVPVVSSSANTTLATTVVAPSDVSATAGTNTLVTAGGRQLSLGKYKNKQHIRTSFAISERAVISDLCYSALAMGYKVQVQDASGGGSVMAPVAMLILKKTTGKSLPTLAIDWYSTSYLNGSPVEFVSSKILEHILTMKDDKLKEIYLACGFRSSSAEPQCCLCWDQMSHTGKVCVRFPTLAKRRALMELMNFCIGCGKKECTIGKAVHPDGFERECQRCKHLHRAAIHTDYLCDNEEFWSDLWERFIGIQCFAACAKNWDASDVKSVYKDN